MVDFGNGDLERVFYTLMATLCLFNLKVQSQVIYLNIGGCVCVCFVVVIIVVIKHHLMSLVNLL
jgi:hypothetical protein